MKKPPWLQRHLARRWLRQHSEESFNRRVKVEKQLGEVVSGKRELPDQDQCNEWRKILGIPNYHGE